MTDYIKSLKLENPEVEWNKEGQNKVASMAEGSCPRPRLMWGHVFFYFLFWDLASIVFSGIFTFYSEFDEVHAKVHN